MSSSPTLPQRCGTDSRADEIAMTSEELVKRIIEIIVSIFALFNVGNNGPTQE